MSWWRRFFRRRSQTAATHVWSDVGPLTDTRAYALREAEIREHLLHVTDGDHMLAAVREILALRLLESASFAGSHASDDTLKLRQCERMECFRLLLLEIDQRRAQAIEWQDEQRQKAQG